MRFSLRALMVFVAVVGGPLALYARRINQNRYQETVAESLDRFPGIVSFCEEDEDAWLPCRRVERICLSGRGFTDEDLRLVASLKHVDSFALGDSEITDQSLSVLKACRS